MRSNILMNALSVSMEGIDPTENIEINPVSEETTVAVDEALDEMNDAEEVVEEHDDAVEELEGAADSMESLVVALESAVKAGGMSPRTADMHNRAMAIAVRRLPVDAEHFTVSTESFGGTGDKLTASMEALEGAKELLSKIWTAIKNAVVKAWQAVMNFITTLGKSARALKKASGLLKAQAGGLSGSAPDKKIDAIAFARIVHKDGKFDHKVVSEPLRGIVTNGNKIVAFTNKATETLKSSAYGIASWADVSKMEKNKVEVTIDTQDLPKEEIYGGYVIESSNDKNSWGVPRLKKATEFKDETCEIDVPARNEIVALASRISDIADMVEQYDNKYFKNAKKEIDQAIKKADQLVKQVEENKETRNLIRSNLRALRVLTSVPRSVGPEYMAFSARAAKAAFNLGKKAVAAYKSK